MTKRIGWGIFLWGLLAAGLNPVLAADLILTAPPRESKSEGQKLYGPLADYLSGLIGQKVVYKHPRNWLKYQSEMRDDKYDIVFDGPHFIAWRIAHIQHDVLVKLPGQLEFYLVAKTEDKSINSLDDLIGHKICGISPPNLSTLTLLDRYRNPVRQPVINGIKGGMAKVYEAFAKGQCKAAVLRTPYFEKKLQAAQRDKLKILFHSTPLPNQGITVSRRLSATAKNQILQSLTLGDGVSVSSPLVKRFGGKNARSFIPAKNEEYDGYNMLLEGIIFGW